MKNATISDVAKLSGVSKSTVSNYLNGNFERMSDETKKKIKNAIDELGYTPSLSARRLSSKNHSKTVCLAIPRNISHLNDTMYYPVIFSALGEEAKKFDYNTLIYSMDSDDINKDTEYLKSLSSSLVDGILLYDLEEDSLAFREFERAGIPYVCVGKIRSVENYNYVASDHGKAMKDALEYFYNLEHKKVAIITEGKSNSVVQTVRSMAFNEFMSEMKDERLDYSYIRINQNESSSDIKLLFNELLNPANRPTAVGITSCFMSQFMDVVKGYGIRIPEDLSVMILEYYKNSNVDEEYQDFTCVESKAEKVTRIAMRKLVKLIDSGKPFESDLVGLKVCVKNSTSKPKKQGGRKL